MHDCHSKVVVVMIMTTMTVTDVVIMMMTMTAGHVVITIMTMTVVDVQVIPYTVMDIFSNLPGMPGLFLASLFSASLRYTYLYRDYKEYDHVLPSPL